MAVEQASSSNDRTHLRILIVGCGIGALACAVAFRKAGHETTIWEKAPVVQEFGAGIQITPNACKALHHLGLLEHVMEHAHFPASAVVRAYDSAEILSQQRLGDLMVHLYGHSYTMLHRVDLHRTLYDEAVKLGADIQLAHPVIAVDCDNATAKAANGKVWRGDLIVGADGEKSICREAVIGRPTPSVDSGDHVFRMVIPSAHITEYPELAGLLDPSSVTVTMGPHGHAVTYYLKQDGLLNVVLMAAHEHPEERPKPPHPVDIDQVRQDFAGWKLPELVLKVTEQCSRWTLLDTPAADQWIKGNVVLVGDAAHPMLPTLGQGAAMALEDAVVLSTLVNHVSNDSSQNAQERINLPSALDLFFDARVSRTRFLREKARSMRNIFAIPPGPDQKLRDQLLRSDMDAIGRAGVEKNGYSAIEKRQGFAKDSPNFLTDVSFRDMLFGYDAGSVGKDIVARLEHREF